MHETATGVYGHFAGRPEGTPHLTDQLYASGARYATSTPQADADHARWQADTIAAMREEGYAIPPKVAEALTDLDGHGATMPDTDPRVAAADLIERRVAAVTRVDDQEGITS